MVSKVTMCMCPHGGEQSYSVPVPQVLFNEQDVCVHVVFSWWARWQCACTCSSASKMTVCVSSVWQPPGWPFGAGVQWRGRHHCGGGGGGSAGAAGEEWCLWSVPAAFLSYVRVQNVSTVGFLWSSTNSFPFLCQSAKCIHSWVPVVSTNSFPFLCQSAKCVHSWVPVVSTNIFPFFRVQNVSTAGCLWSVPTAFLSYFKVQNVSQLGAFGQYQQLSFHQSKYKMYPQLVPVVSTNSFPFIKVPNVATTGCLWLVPTAFFSSEYKMYPQLDACGQYQQLLFLQSEYKMYHSWVPVVSSNSFPFFKVQIVFTAGCLWSVPIAFSIAGCLWSVPTAFLSLKYKMYPQLGACGQYQQPSFLQLEYKMYLWLGACV